MAVLGAVLLLSNGMRAIVSVFRNEEKRRETTGELNYAIGTYTYPRNIDPLPTASLLLIVGSSAVLLCVQVSVLWREW